MERVLVVDMFCKAGYFHVKPACGNYDKIYRAAKGVYWDETTESLYYKGNVSQEDAIRFICEAMENEYRTELVFK